MDNGDPACWSEELPRRQLPGSSPAWREGEGYCPTHTGSSFARSVSLGTGCVEGVSFMMSVQLTRSMSRIHGIDIRPVTPDDASAVRALFGALHAYNAGLNPQFTLAEGWEQVLVKRLAQADDVERGLILLA
jgi:hypothetical protein